MGLVLFAGNSLEAAPHPVLSRHVPAAVSNLRPVRKLEAESQLTVEIGLPWRNAEQLPGLVEEIYDPGSTNYHRYLTVQEFTERFGPDPADYQKVIDFARAHGLTVTKTFADSSLLVVNGRVADIENAFHTRLQVYPHPNESRNFFAPDAEPSLDLEVPVQTIGGLDNFVVPRPMSLHRAANATSANPNAFTGSSPGGNFMGNDFRAAYLPGVALTGAGQKVGLLEFDGYYASDITAYENLAGLPHVPLTNVWLDSYSGAVGTNNIEVALDIEMAVSMAPGLSQIVVYEGDSGNTIITQMANDTNVLQFSASWTYPINSTTTNLFARLAAQGQSFFNASGDSGAYTSFGNQVAPPTDVPYLTSVGGTTLTTTGPGGAWVSETVWNWFTTGQGNAASSGGISQSYSIPSWQKNISMTTSKGSSSARNIPDVALTADNIYVIFNNGSAGEVGGTSAACPLWAAFTALINQQNAASGGTNVGLINPAIYAIGKGASYSNSFHDITTGNNHNNFTSSRFSAVAGYDLCTGWGTPIGAVLISALGNGAPVITQQPSNMVVAPGGNATFSVGAAGNGTLSYQWTFNGTNISLATGSSYSITNAQTNNQGNYAVVVSNAVGSVTSSNALLTVNSPPSIDGQPQSLTVAAGNTATFTVFASGLPAPTYQWQFNGTNIALATQSTLAITNAQLMNQGNYRVLVSNSGGTVASSNAVLTVNAPPMVTSQPASHILSPGAHTVFVVGANGSPTLTYQWIFDGANIPGATGASYQLSNIQFTNQGNYQAIISNNFGAVTSAVATLTVNAPPVITTQPQDQNLVAGGNAQFSVTAIGSALMGFQWLSNLTPLMDNGHVTGSASANLSITNVLVPDAGNYSVIITNAYGAVTSSVAVLSVAKATPLVTWVNPAGIIYGTALGANQLNATADETGSFIYSPVAGIVPSAGVVPLSVVFTPDDTTDFNSVTNAVTLAIAQAALTVTASNATRIYGQANPVFTATVVGAVNGDVFTASASCNATATNLPGSYPIMASLADPNNRAGNYLVTTNNGTLTITAAPAPTIISITPTNGSTNGGDIVTIYGSGFQNGATVNFGTLAAVSVNVTNDTNIIVVTPTSVAGEVDVVLTNADGQSFVLTNGFTYIEAAQTNFQAAQLATQPTNQSVTVGGSVSFSVNANGSNPLSYQWLFNQANVPGATDSMLSYSNVQASNAGFYEVIVSNAYGASTSSIATLSVLGVPVSFVTAPGSVQYGNGQFGFQIGGLTGQGPVVIQSSSNLTDWLSIYTNAAGFGQFQFMDTNAGGAMGWYRAVVEGK